MYSAAELRKDLENISTEDKDIPKLAAAAKEVCKQHGVHVAINGNQKEKGDGGRLVATTLKCVNGMPNRQREVKDRANGEHTVRVDAPPPPSLFTP